MNKVFKEFTFEDTCFCEFLMLYDIRIHLCSQFVKQNALQSWWLPLFLSVHWDKIPDVYRLKQEGPQPRVSCLQKRYSWQTLLMGWHQDAERKEELGRGCSLLLGRPYLIP